jgi:DNA-binding LacI/PurR family transcriptional regulator
LSARFHEKGLGILLGNSRNDMHKEFEFIDLFTARKARGIIFTGEKITEEHIKKFNSCEIPLLVVDQEHEELNCPVIVFDNYQASYDVVKLLFAHGHKDIGFISCPTEDRHAGLLRQKGYRDALLDHGIQFNQALLQYAEFTMDSGYRAMEKMFKEFGDVPSVIFGATDNIAIGAMKFLHQKKYSIPGDISVFGFDNIPVSSKLIPSLSSVELDHYECGTFAADFLFQLADAPSSGGIKKVVFRHRIIIRESCL